MDLKHICAVIESVLTDVLPEDDFDISIDMDGSEATIEADEWTLQLGGVEGALTAFLAIDDEPESDAQYAAAVRSALGHDTETALSDADAELNGALSAALIASGDPFSGAFAAAIRPKP